MCARFAFAIWRPLRNRTTPGGAGLAEDSHRRASIDADRRGGRGMGAWKSSLQIQAGRRSSVKSIADRGFFQAGKKRVKLVRMCASAGCGCRKTVESGRRRRPTGATQGWGLRCLRTRERIRTGERKCVYECACAIGTPDSTGPGRTRGRRPARASLRYWGGWIDRGWRLGRTRPRAFGRRNAGVSC